MIENRIYLDNKLVNICFNEYALLCNLTSYVNKYGKDRITLKRLDEATMDNEKQEWLNSW